MRPEPCQRESFYTSQFPQSVNITLAFFAIGTVNGYRTVGPPPDGTATWSKLARMCHAIAKDMLDLEPFSLVPSINQLSIMQAEGSLGT